MALRASLLVVFALAVIAGCTYRAGSFCHNFAEAVVECCPDEDYDAHYDACSLDVRGGRSQCASAGRKLYTCFEDSACYQDCTLNRWSCAADFQSFVNACSVPSSP